MRFIVTLVLLAAQGMVNGQLSVGDTGCVEGFVMDRFCIDRTTLLDNPSVVTLSLEGPMVHTVRSECRERRRKKEEESTLSSFVGKVIPL